MKLGQDSVERIRCREVSRALEKMDLSPEKEEVIERLSRSLVGKLLHGPIYEVVARAGAEISSVGRRGPEASPGPKTGHDLYGDGMPFTKPQFGIQGVRSPTTLHDQAEKRIGAGPTEQTVAQV
jgi:hypothetical protein